MYLETTVRYFVKLLTVEALKEQLVIPSSCIRLSAAEAG